jgi:hypothetical protein
VPVRASSVRWVAALLAFTSLASCSDSGDDETANDATTAAPAPDTTASDTSVVATPANGSLFPAGDVDAGLQPWVELATTQLAAALGTEPAEVGTVSAVLVVWPDSGLGCPAPGEQYATVLTDGAVIELEADGDVYRFHAGGDRGPFLCERPITTAPPRA